MLLQLQKKIVSNWNYNKKMLILLSFVEETLENIEQKLNEISGQAFSVAGENFKAAIDLGISLGFLELRENEILLIYPPYILENLKKNVLVRIYENENDSSGNESNTSNHEEGLDGIEPDEAARCEENQKKPRKWPKA